MIDIIQILKKIEEQKQKKKIIPSNVLYNELMDEVNHQVRVELNNLFLEKKIKIGETLNDRYIKIL